MGEDTKSETAVGDIPRTDDTASKVDEKKLVRKLDMHIIPLIMALYLFSFLDRSVFTPNPLARNL